MALFPLGLLSQGGGGAGAGSFEQIETVIASGSTASVTFSSIPSTYKHLQIRATHRALYSFSGDLLHLMRLNGDSSSNYNWHSLAGQDSSAYVGGGTSATSMRIGLTPAALTTANAFATSIIDILDYTNTNKHTTIKTLVGSNGTQHNVGLYSGAWRNTSAVTSLTLLNDVGFGNYTSGSRFTLYGIKG
jgi:hypothetical protein